MALVAMVKKQLSDKLKVLSDNQILEGASLAAILPGPLAVNSVVYYGFVLSGIQGAFVSFLGILLPTSLLVMGFAVLYYSAGMQLSASIAYVIPVIAAIIASVGYAMARKQIKLPSQWVLAILAFLVSVTATHVLLLIGTILTGGVAGYFFYRDKQAATPVDTVPSRLITRKEMITLAGILAVGSLALVALAYAANQLEASLALSSVFSGMSLTLFGGGYVIIPIMQQALVSDLGWVTLQEFNAAIGISQVTPGPILSSVTFIGYKMAGISGAVMATISIFLPSAMLMLFLTHVHEKIKHLKAIGAVMMGIRAVVIGLIFSGAYTIGIKTFGLDWLPWTIFAGALAASLFTKIHPALLIGAAFTISFL